MSEFSRRDLLTGFRSVRPVEAQTHPAINAPANKDGEMTPLTLGTWIGLIGGLFGGVAAAALITKDSSIINRREALTIAASDTALGTAIGCATGAGAGMMVEIVRSLGTKWSRSLR